MAGGLEPAPGAGLRDVGGLGEGARRVVERGQEVRVAREVDRDLTSPRPEDYAEPPIARQAGVAEEWEMQVRAATR